MFLRVTNTEEGMFCTFSGILLYSCYYHFSYPRTEPIHSRNGPRDNALLFVIRGVPRVERISQELEVSEALLFSFLSFFCVCVGGGSIRMCFFLIINHALI